MTAQQIQERAEKAAEDLVRRCNQHTGGWAACRSCIAAVIADELKQAEAKLEALRECRHAWWRYGNDLMSGTLERAEAADARAREVGAIE